MTHKPNARINRVRPAPVLAGLACWLAFIWIFDWMRRFTLRRKHRFIHFGPNRLHRRYGVEHFLVVGVSGSGKTLIVKGVMDSVFHDSIPGRACVYDGKLDLLPSVYAATGTHPDQIDSGDARVKLLNPLDVRAYAWDLAKDIDSPITAAQFAKILVPDGEGAENDGSFFDCAVRDILSAVLLVLINHVPNKGSWTFRDLILASMYEPYTRYLFDLAESQANPRLPVVSRVQSTYLDCDPKTSSNIRATMSTKLSIFEPVAACWDAARKLERTVSLSDWASDDSRDILVLGNDEASRACMDPINRALFKRISELTISRRESSDAEKRTGDNQTWFILDEIKEAGRLDGLSSLLTKGRSKGASIVLAFQDIEGLRHVYGEKIANELTSQCNNAAFLRITSPATSQWAADSFGSKLRTAQSRGMSLGSDGQPNMSNDTHEEERPLLYTADLMELPLPTKKRGVFGFYRMAGIPIKSRRDTFAVWKPKMAKKPKGAPESHPSLSAFIARPVEDQYLMPWDESDFERLGFPSGVPPLGPSAKPVTPKVEDLMRDFLNSKPAQDEAEPKPKPQDDLSEEPQEETDA